MIDKINNYLNKINKDKLYPILFIPFILSSLYFAINVVPIYKTILKVENNIFDIKEYISKLENNSDYKKSQNLKLEISFLNQELEKNNIDIRDLRKEFQWEYIIGLINETFVGPEILEYNDKYILFTSKEKFSELYKKIKRYELERKTSSIDYIFYNAQNKTYIIKINKKAYNEKF